MKKKIDIDKLKQLKSDFDDLLKVEKQQREMIVKTIQSAIELFNTPNEAIKWVEFVRADKAIKIFNQLTYENSFKVHYFELFIFLELYAGEVGDLIEKIELQNL